MDYYYRLANNYIIQTIRYSITGYPIPRSIWDIYPGNLYHAVEITNSYVEDQDWW